MTTKFVTTNTDGVGSPYILANEKSEYIFENSGASEKNYYTLPAFVRGITFTFYVNDAWGIRVVAQ